MKKRLVVLYSLLIIISTVTSVFSMSAKPQKPERPYCETDYPIILVPGVLGFDSVFGIDYFYAITDSLEEDGAIVYTASLSGLSGTEQRGEQLLAFIDAIKTDNPEYTKFNVIAHSQGSTTSRYAMKLRPDAFASLTTIAGPHQGTPFADYVNEEISDKLLAIAYPVLEMLGGDLVAIFSGDHEFVGSQDAASLVEHFTKDGIEQFNNEYPCAGVPKGASNGSFGDDADTIDGSFYGDGLGNADGDIRFYSWTGNTGKGSVTWVDVLDAAFVVTNSFVREYGYNGDADGFVTVSSSHFGEVLCDTYYWNHGDEVNHLLGLINPFAANPVSVFRQHANRLQKAGY